MPPIDNRLPATWHATAAAAGASLATVALNTVVHEAANPHRSRLEAVGVRDTQAVLGSCGVFGKSSNHVAAATFVGTWAAVTAGMHLVRGLNKLRHPHPCEARSQSIATQRREQAGMAWTWAGVEAAANCTGHLIFGYSGFHGCSSSNEGLATNAVLLGTNLVLGLKNLGMAIGSRRIMSAALAQQAAESDPLERRAIADRAFSLARGLRTGEPTQAHLALALGMTYFGSMAFTIYQQAQEGAPYTFADLSPLLKTQAYACVTVGAAAALQGISQGLGLPGKVSSLGQAAANAWRAWRKQAEASDG